MTEEAFQAARKIMKTANMYRGHITSAKEAVAKWTKLEDVYRRELKHGQADGAKKMLNKAIERLNHWREKFANLKFPEDSIQFVEEFNRCAECGTKISKEATYCADCENPVYSKQ